ncbi:MAG TPA: DUF1707 domain-containing protein [Gemmatimonadaceae bacterium]|nr:DUF1707 domain-containing protein [Gemmatimonadaceae bacterium]
MPPSPLPSDVNSAARERVVELLSRHFANDVISMDEFETRVERAYHAPNAVELAAVVADLPQLAEVPGRSGDLASTEVQHITATLSGQERRITAVVPRRMELRSRLGYIEIDFTQATFPPGLTEIDIHAFLGYVQIRLPAGVHAECLGTAMAGFFSLKGAGEAQGPDAASIVRITGRATFGFAECVMRRREVERLLEPGAE